MPDEVGAHVVEERHDPGAFEQIEFVKMKILVSQRPRHIVTLSEKVIVDAVDLMAAVEEARQKVRGDEAGGAGDDDSQASAARDFASSSGVPISKKL